MQFRTSPRDAGNRLLDILLEKFSSTSRRALKRQVDAGLCRVNGVVETYGSVRLKVGDEVEFCPQSLAAPELTAEAILWADEHLAFINKPPGFNSEGEEFFSQLYPLIGGARCVHRLDKQTSGVIVVARSALAEEALGQQFRERKVVKRYLAIADGEALPPEGMCDSWLGCKKGLQGQKLWGRVSPEKGKRAITSYSCQKKGNGLTLVECRPQTGRTHQIRVHLSEKGAPIIGDVLYGRRVKSSYRPARLLLHAAYLELIHPVTGEKLGLNAPLPNDFKEAIAYIDSPGSSEKALCKPSSSKRPR